MPFDGTLTWEEFAKCAEFLLSVSDSLKDGWSLEGPKGRHSGPWSQTRSGALFLVKRDVILDTQLKAASADSPARPLAPAPAPLEPQATASSVPLDDPDEEALADISADSGELEPAHSLEPPSPNPRFAVFEFHVVYSKSYNVPVLYFNASQLDGRRLAPTQVWNSMQQLYKESVNVEQQSFLSQMDHPVLGRPFVFLHPCQTRTMMWTLFGSSSTQSGLQRSGPFNYLLAWLSVVAPFVGLTLPIAYMVALDAKSEQ